MSDLPNPLQNIISQASQLPDSGQLKDHCQRVKAQAVGCNIMFLDVSGSMGERAGRRKKITIMRNVVDELDTSSRFKDSR